LNEKGNRAQAASDKYYLLLTPHSRKGWHSRSTFYAWIKKPDLTLDNNSDKKTFALPVNQRSAVQRLAANFLAARSTPLSGGATDFVTGNCRPHSEQSQDAAKTVKSCLKSS
jgi:hypothetical protein